MLSDVVAWYRPISAGKFAHDEPLSVVVAAGLDGYGQRSLAVRRNDHLVDARPLQLAGIQLRASAAGRPTAAFRCRRAPNVLRAAAWPVGWCGPDARL